MKQTVKKVNYKLYLKFYNGIATNKIIAIYSDLLRLSRAAYPETKEYCKFCAFCNANIDNNTYNHEKCCEKQFTKMVGN